MERTLLSRKYGYKHAFLKNKVKGLKKKFADFIWYLALIWSNKSLLLFLLEKVPFWWGGFMINLSQNEFYLKKKIKWKMRGILMYDQLL